MAFRDLRQSPNAWPSTTLLGRLSDNARHGLLTLGIHRKFLTQRELIRQGDENRYSLLLLSGTVKVFSTDESGYDVLLGFRAAGDLVGEMATLEDIRRTATVTACSPVTARQIGRAELTRFLGNYPEVGLEVSKMLISRLRWANQRRIDFGACTARARVGRTLIELASRHGHYLSTGWTLGVPVLQAELASLAGVKLNTVEKTLSELRKQEIVAPGREILIIDMDRLRRYSDLI